MLLSPERHANTQTQNKKQVQQCVGQAKPPLTCGLPTVDSKLTSVAYGAFCYPSVEGWNVVLNNSYEGRRMHRKAGGVALPPLAHSANG